MVGGRETHDQKGSQHELELNSQTPHWYCDTVKEVHYVNNNVCGLHSGIGRDDIPRKCLPKPIKLVKPNMM